MWRMTAQRRKTYDVRGPRSLCRKVGRIAAWRLQPAMRTDEDREDVGDARGALHMIAWSFYQPKISLAS